MGACDLDSRIADWGSEDWRFNCRLRGRGGTHDEDDQKIKECVEEDAEKEIAGEQVNGAKGEADDGGLDDALVALVNVIEAEEDGSDENGGVEREVEGGGGEVAGEEAAEEDFFADAGGDGNCGKPAALGVGVGEHVDDFAELAAEGSFGFGARGFAFDAVEVGCKGECKECGEENDERVTQPQRLGLEGVGRVEEDERRTEEKDGDEGGQPLGEDNGAVKFELFGGAGRDGQERALEVVADNGADEDKEEGKEGLEDEVNGHGKVLLNVNVDSHSHFVKKKSIIFCMSADNRLSNPRAVQERSRKTLEKLLVAATEVLDEHGMEGATIPRIAERAGVSVGSVYRRFRDKDALLCAAMINVLERAVEQNRESLRPERFAGLKFEVVVRAIVHAILMQFRLRPGLMAAMDNFVEKHPNVEFRARALGLLAENYDRLSDVLLLYADEIKHEEKRRAVGFAILSAVTVLQVRTLQDDSVWKRVVPMEDKEIEKEMTEMMVKYLKTWVSE